MDETKDESRIQDSIKKLLHRYKALDAGNVTRNNPVIYETGRFCLPDQKNLDAQYSKVYLNRYTA